MYCWNKMHRAVSKDTESSSYILDWFVIRLLFFARFFRFHAHEIWPLFSVLQFRSHSIFRLLKISHFLSPTTEQTQIELQDNFAALNLTQFYSFLYRATRVFTVSHYIRYTNFRSTQKICRK